MTLCLVKISLALFKYDVMVSMLVFLDFQAKKRFSFHSGSERGIPGGPLVWQGAVMVGLVEGGHGRA